MRPVPMSMVAQSEARLTKDGIAFVFLLIYVLTGIYIGLLKLSFIVHHASSRLVGTNGGGFCCSIRVMIVSFIQPMTRRDNKVSQY